MENIPSAWYIVPTIGLLRDRYRGKGRPRKTDYGILPLPPMRSIENEIFKIVRVEKDHVV